MRFLSLLFAWPVLDRLASCIPIVIGLCFMGYALFARSIRLNDGKRGRIVTDPRQSLRLRFGFLAVGTTVFVFSLLRAIRG
jgi:hypothetical protein